VIAEETQNIATEGVLLRKDTMGAIRIAKTRVLLDLVVNAYNRGKTPEQIQEAYTSLELPDVYMVIGYYLRNKAEVDAYIEEGEKHAEEVRLKHKEREDAFHEKLRRRLKPHLYENQENAQ
jgi:uncharacterized protein (DUF433 family)